MHVFNMTAGSLRLFDLVKPSEERFKPVFYAVLGNTLVTETLDQATAIAYGPRANFRRIVTLRVRVLATMKKPKQQETNTGYHDKYIMFL